MLSLWGRVNSSNVQAVRWCLAELGIEYERIDAGFVYGVTNTDEYRRMNPNGTVPTIKDGDNAPLFETGAILRYLANTYAPDCFWPEKPAQRAFVDMWAEWAKINVAMQFTTPLFWPLVRVPVARRNYKEISAANKVLEGSLRIADERLASAQFLASNELTLADIQFGHTLYRYYDIDLERAAFKHIRRYYTALTERSTFRDTVMLPYDDLRDTL